jgi:hypothetical protein
MAQKPNETFVVYDLAFVAEQNGLPEDELKESLRSVFRRHRALERAYLVRARYGQGGSQKIVMLCMVAPSDPKLFAAAARPFREQFAPGNFLDGMFLDAVREKEVQAVAKPFYVRAMPSPRLERMKGWGAGFGRSLVRQLLNLNR